MSALPQVTRIGCYAVISDSGKLLACRLADHLAHHGKWTLPGGGLDFGETLEQATVREVFEETGLHVKVKELLSYASWRRDFNDQDLHLFQFLFSVDILGGELTHEVNGSTDWVEWIDLDSINEHNSVDIVLRAAEILRSRS